MNKTISNSFLTITIKSMGAEITSIKSDENREYIWQADPAVWGRHAPVLFPIVGKLANNQYRFEGKTYSLNQHGFARDMRFSFVEENETSLSCQLLPTPETKQVYPFDFSLLIHYRLVKNSVEVSYEVKNNDTKVMPFSIGAHPAFALNWGKKDKVEDYYLQFEKKETADTRHLDKNALLSDETERVLNDESVIPLKDDMFNRDALIFLELVSEKVSLKSYRHDQQVTVTLTGFPYLGIWAKPKAKYVCIEPWYGHVDPANTDGILMNKPGIIRLEPGAAFSCNYSIQIN